MFVLRHGKSKFVHTCVFHQIVFVSINESSVDLSDILHPEIKLNTNLMQLGNFIYVFLAVHISGTYGHRQEQYMLSCSVWFCALHHEPLLHTCKLEQEMEF